MSCVRLVVLDGYYNWQISTINLSVVLFPVSKMTHVTIPGLRTLLYFFEINNRKYFRRFWKTCGKLVEMKKFLGNYGYFSNVK